jgi:hypothetical protein
MMIDLISPLSLLDLIQAMVPFAVIRPPISDRVVTGEVIDPMPAATLIPGPKRTILAVLFPFRIIRFSILDIPWTANPILRPEPGHGPLAFLLPFMFMRFAIGKLPYGARALPISESVTEEEPIPVICPLTSVSVLMPECGDPVGIVMAHSGSEIFQPRNPLFLHIHSDTGTRSQPDGWVRYVVDQQTAES